MKNFVLLIIFINIAFASGYKLGEKNMYEDTKKDIDVANKRTMQCIETHLKNTGYVR